MKCGLYGHRHWSLGAIPKFFRVSMLNALCFCFGNSPATELLGSQKTSQQNAFKIASNPRCLPKMSLFLRPNPRKFSGQDLDGRIQAHIPKPLFYSRSPSWAAFNSYPHRSLHQILHLRRSTICRCHRRVKSYRTALQNSRAQKISTYSAEHHT